ncbi:MAG: toxin-antitoxin system YwqK family antitoxin [Crocinitomicaceae bacterium]|nr:toxin-antitoxin system YwqK family antitoxin [Crocinitomicaceae bacterium]
MGKKLKKTKIYTLLVFVFISILSFSQTEEIKLYYENGKLKEEYTLVDGKKDGLIKYYHENGQLSMEYTLVDGKLNGLWKEYYENGKIRSEGNYVEGNRDGLWKEYYLNGHIGDEINYKGGNRDGLHKMYHVPSTSEWNGKDQRRLMYIINMKDDGFHGPYKSFYENGNLKVEGNYIDGNPDGIWKYYWESNGKLKEIKTFKDGVEVE